MNQAINKNLYEGRPVWPAGRLLAGVAVSVAVVVVASCGSSLPPKSAQAVSQARSTSSTMSTAASTTSSTAAHSTRTRTQRTRKAPRSSARKVTISVTVPHLLPGGYLASRYTCDGGDASPAVRWSGIPSGTGELVLFVVSFQPVNGKLFFDWALAGLPPASRGIPAGRLPTGAVVGRNSAGQDRYTICPPKGRTENYAVRVVALPHGLRLRPGFDALALYRQAERSSDATSFAAVTYTRRG
jgi:phosphatidylethanolamine-binding protein (PEBP) family uncharacterized protein